MTQNIINTDFINKKSLVELGRSLHWFRAEKHYSLTQVSQKTGLSPKIIENIECGKENFVLSLYHPLLKFYQLEVFVSLGEWYV